MARHGLGTNRAPQERLGIALAEARMHRSLMILPCRVFDCFRQAGRSALILLGLLAILCGKLQAEESAGTTLRLHPENPQYFQWRGKATALITSAEHYGAVINSDFDYRKYLNALAADGMNYTRVMVGSYVEKAAASLSGRKRSPAKS